MTAPRSSAPCLSPHQWRAKEATPTCASVPFSKAHGAEAFASTQWSMVRVTVGHAMWTPLLRGWAAQWSSVCTSLLPMALSVWSAACREKSKHRPQLLAAPSQGSLVDHVSSRSWLVPRKKIPLLKPEDQWYRRQGGEIQKVGLLFVRRSGLSVCSDLSCGLLGGASKRNRNQDCFFLR